MADIIPTVPIRTDFFDGDGRITRPWVIFFERIRKSLEQLTEQVGEAGTGTGGGPYIRTLLINDTVLRADTAHHVPIYIAGSAMRVIGVLAQPILSDLTIEIKLNGTVILTPTIPYTTAVDTPLTWTAFVDGTLGDLGVLTWGVTASDGSLNAVTGIATFTLEWSQG